jgi:preprotein translocase subunit SecA
MGQKIHRTIRRWNGSKLEWDCTPYRATVEAIRGEAGRFAALNDGDLSASASSFRDQVRSGTNPDLLLVPVFALVKEAVRRILHLNTFDEQLICGIVLHQGKLAELQTGEGKTLAAVFPAVLNALDGKGVHILTFNDYLAGRDTQWMGPVYRLLGLTVGTIRQGLTIAERQAAYGCDITYLTAREAGFDFLRDGCCTEQSLQVQRNFNFAIVDEADSILIDEARIPMVVAAPSNTPNDTLVHLAALVREMRADTHFTFDQYQRKICLTDGGADLAEKKLGCGNLYAESGGDTLCRLYHALHAEYLLHRDVDYLVRGKRIELIDELTGRVAENRRWPDALHAAVEAKEGCPVQPRGSVRGEITMRHFIARYPKLSAMTATAERAEEEFFDWYRLATVVIPPHRSCIRNDFPDRIFRTRDDKQQALVAEIIAVNATGRPILVGTRTVRESEELSAQLTGCGIACKVLNANNDAQEAAIIANAGTFGAVTISTNMAGRGTDIRLGGADGHDYQRIASLGGLYVIGTNRFESRRIDDQLRGRAGRQGDPGSSRFFISLEDDLFVKYRIGELIPKRYCTTLPGGCIENAYVNNEVNRLQRIIEGQNGDIRETLAKYSVLAGQQRAIIAAYRYGVLSSENIPDIFLEKAVARTNEIRSRRGSAAAGSICRILLLHELDSAWSAYLADMADVRDGIHFRRFGNQDPLHVYNSLAIERFAAVIPETEKTAVTVLNALNEHEIDLILRSGAAEGHPSATWTYLVSDNPFEERPDILMSGSAGFSAAAGLLWPILAVMVFMRRREKQP